jgi:predicted protein tyrosine phosphatase
MRFSQTRGRTLPSSTILSNPTARYAPSMDDVRSILEFTTALDSSARLLVHCMMGISRFAAIALATLNFHAGPGHEAACFVALRRIRPSACPNPMMIHFADSILGRNGALIESVKKLCRNRRGLMRPHRACKTSRRVPNENHAKPVLPFSPPAAA